MFATCHQEIMNKLQKINEETLIYKKKLDMEFTKLIDPVYFNLMENSVDLSNVFNFMNSNNTSNWESMRVFNERKSNLDYQRLPSTKYDSSNKMDCYLSSKRHRNTRESDESAFIFEETRKNKSILSTLTNDNGITSTNLTNMTLPIALDEKKEENKQKSNEQNKKKIFSLLMKNPTDFNKRSDCIRKRIKALVNNHIVKKLNSLLDSENSNKKLHSLPRCHSIDVKKAINRRLLDKTIEEIFVEEVEDKKEMRKVLHNRKIVKSIKEPSFKEILNKKFKDFYEEYVSSNQYKEDMEKLLERESKDYIDYFQQHVESFVAYYK